MDRRSSTITALISFLVFIALEALCIVFIAKDGVIQRYKVMVGVRNVQSYIWSKGENFRYYNSLKQTNQELRDDNIRLIENIEKYRSIAASFVADSTMQAYKPEYDYIPAKVVKNTTNKVKNYIIIDKGSEDGVEEDMGVITPNGVVGYVHSVGKNYSLVGSLLDVNYTITATIKNNGTFGTLYWDGKNTKEATLSEIPVHTQFAIGDTITTNGYSAVFPAGIEIGRIKSSSINSGTSFDLKIDLFLNYSNLHFVYVVKNPNNREVTELIKKGEEM